MINTVQYINFLLIYQFTLPYIFLVFLIQLDCCLVSSSCQHGFSSTSQKYTATLHGLVTQNCPSVCKTYSQLPTYLKKTSHLPQPRQGISSIDQKPFIFCNISFDISEATNVRIHYDFYSNS